MFDGFAGESGHAVMQEGEVCITGHKNAESAQGILNGADSGFVCAVLGLKCAGQFVV